MEYPSKTILEWKLQPLFGAAQFIASLLACVQAEK
jgi:hypothetical protein